MGKAENFTNVPCPGAGVTLQFLNKCSVTIVLNKILMTVLKAVRNSENLNTILKQ